MKILNFGSVNIDCRYQVDHFVRPGETLMALDRQIFSGGKGFNQSISLAKAGMEVYHAGCICKTDTFLIEELQEAGVCTEYILKSDLYTGHAIIQVNAEGQNCILLSNGANYSISEEFVDNVLSGFGEGDLLLLQNEINRIPYIMEQAKKRSMGIALNPSPINAELFDYPLDVVDYFLLNEIECQELTGCGDPMHMAGAMLEKYPHSHIVLTLGKRGAVYCDRNHNVRHGIYDVPVRDTTAAGDTFTGYFLAAICSGKEPEQALAQASVASSLSVSRHGAAVSIPYRNEVEQALRGNLLGTPI